MSVVTAVYVLTDLTDSDDDRHLLDALNEGFFDEYGSLVDLTGQTGGTKHPQALIFGGGFNYFDELGCLAFLRGFPWWDHGCQWAQVIMQGEENSGFGLVEVHRAHECEQAWQEPTDV